MVWKQIKQSWHINNADLLKDIICMANNTTIDMQEGYIIFGIEDSTFNIIGVLTDDNRKNQENIIGFLSSQIWAGEEIPNVEVNTIDGIDKSILSEFSNGVAIWKDSQYKSGNSKDFMISLEIK